MVEGGWRVPTAVLPRTSRRLLLSEHLMMVISLSGGPSFRAIAKASRTSWVLLEKNLPKPVFYADGVFALWRESKGTEWTMPEAHSVTLSLNFLFHAVVL